MRHYHGFQTNVCVAKSAHLFIVVKNHLVIKRIHKVIMTCNSDYGWVITPSLRCFANGLALLWIRNLGLNLCRSYINKKNVLSFGTKQKAVKQPGSLLDPGWEKNQANQIGHIIRHMFIWKKSLHSVAVKALVNLISFISNANSKMGWDI